MEFHPLALEGAWRIQAVPIGDSRGYFVRTYAIDAFRERGLQTEWVQENQSKSAAQGTIRGLHFQLPPDTETKLVRVVRGAVLDVLVDLRGGSPTYGHWDAVELTEANFSMVYIPRGFAHGFCTLTPDAVVAYKVDAPYAPKSEGGLPWDDPGIGISWPTDTPVLSDRDRAHQPLSAFETPF